MISRADIENEAAFIRHLIDATNPTGGKHTPTPWKGGDVGGGRGISDAQGQILAMFKRYEDRNLALYFANTHAGIIGILRGEADAWELVRRTVTDAGFQSFAETRAENLRAYADLFCRLGKVEEDAALDTTP